MTTPHRLPTPSKEVREVLKETEKTPPHIELEINAIKSTLDEMKAIVGRHQAFIETLYSEATKKRGS